MRNRTESRPTALRCATLAEAGLAAVILLFTLAVAPTRAEAETRGQEAQRRTVEDLRRIGVAMYGWFQDQAGAKAEATKAEEETDEGDTLAVEAYRTISREDLVKLLVPAYIGEIPARDGWGNSYEFRLNTENPHGGARVMLVRSPAADGTFDDEVYEIGSFDRFQEGEDLVWADGYFIRWPGRAGE